MRSALALILLAACEIQPAPKKQAAPPPPPPAAQVEAPKPVEPTPAPPNAGSAAGLPQPPKIEVNAPCLQVGAKVASVFIDNETDPGQKSIREQERGNLTRKTAEACTVQGWSEEARNCYLATQTPAEINACATKFPRPPRPAPPAPTPPPQGALE